MSFFTDSAREGGYEILNRDEVLWHADPYYRGQREGEGLFLIGLGEMGTSWLAIWTSSLSEAVEIAADWAATHAPGHIAAPINETPEFEDDYILTESGWVFGPDVNGEVVERADSFYREVFERSIGHIDDDWIDGDDLEKIQEIERSMDEAVAIANIQYAAERHGYPYAVRNADDAAVALDWLLERGLASPSLPRLLYGDRDDDFEENPAPEKTKRLYTKLRSSAPHLPAFVISSPRDAVQAIRKLIDDRAYEVFVAIYLDAKNRVISFEEFSSGGLANVDVNTTSIIRNAMLSGAIGIITAHQHPSGDTKPSPADLGLWQQLHSQARLMGLTVLDNLVVTKTGYYSESENES